MSGFGINNITVSLEQKDEDSGYSVISMGRGAAMISGGYFERHIDRLKNYYRTVRSEVTQALASLPYASEVHDTGSGLHLTVTFPQASSDERIRRIAAERGVNIRCLSDYLADSHSECTRTAVINYGGLKKGWAARIAALFD